LYKIVSFESLKRSNFTKERNQRMYSTKNFLFLPVLLLFNVLMAQNYQAIHGSSYAGSMGPGYNPASIVHVPYSWDITPFSLQLKQSTNAFTIKNISLLSLVSLPDSLSIAAKNGIKKRFVTANQDIRLLNARISLNSKTALALGANIRNYFYAGSSKTNGQDTLLTLFDFMKINSELMPLSGEIAGNAWAELYASIALTIIDNGNRLLNAGISLKATRSLAGGYAQAAGIYYDPLPDINQPGYLLTNGSLKYGYSANFDKIDSTKTAAANRKLFLQNNHSGMAADVGMEYIILSDEDKEYGGEYAYETKLGISVMDIGRNKYLHGSRSRLAIAGRPGITESLLDLKFLAIKNLDDFNDSLATIAGTLSTLTGEFFIYQPTRLLINVDQHIVQNFFINAEITIPLHAVIPKKIRSIKELNLLAFTARWELKSVGVYLPILLNNRNQLWVGGAFKAGPLLLGTHNLGNLFSKNKFQSGGLYLAFTVRPKKLYDRESHYPTNKLPKKDRQRLDCPKF
jgi:hypothetical protein